MLDRALPRPIDFFPHTRRGHGSAHFSGQHKVMGFILPRCIADDCAINRKGKGAAHDDQASNANEWRAERGYHKDVPLELCTRRR